jgi:ABC-2 type transport system ATP-binding protein
MCADYIGIISDGVLGYEGELCPGQNLEELFMDVVKKNHKLQNIA